MQLRADFIVGTQLPNSWSGVYGFKPEDSIEPLELFAVIKLESQSTDTNLEPLAKMFLDELQNYLFSEGKEGDYIIRLENAVWKMKSKMEVLLSSDERYAQTGLDIEIALTLFDRNFLYLGVIGESKIFIRRGDKFVELSKGLADGNMMGFLKTGSLELEPNDRIVIATSTAGNTGIGSIELAAENLNIDNLSSLTNNNGIAVLLLADEKDQWALKTIDEPVEVKVPVENIQEEGSAKYIPIQEEDFDENLETPTEVTEEGIELDPTVESMPVQEQELKGLSEDLETVENVHQVDPKAVPQGRLLLSNIKGKLALGLSTGKSGLSKVKNTIQERRAKNTLPEDLSEGDLETGDDSMESNFQEGDEVEEVSKPSSNKAIAVLQSVLSKIKYFAQTKILPFFKKSNKTYVKYLRDFVLIIINIIKKFLGWFKKEFIGGGVDDRRDIFNKAKRRKRNRIILVILVVVLAVVIISTINNRNAQLAEQARIDAIQNNINDYKSQLDSLVRQSAGSNLNDTQKASLTEQLDKLNSNLDIIKQKGLSVDDIVSYQDTISKTKDKINGAVAVTNPQIIADLGKVYSDANLTDIVYTQGNLYVSDKARNTIYQLGTNINSEVKQFVTGLNAPYTLTVNVAGDVIFYDADATSSVGKISIGEGGKVTRYGGLAPGVIGTVTKAAVYSGNDALYEIHQNHQQIFRRDAVGDQYGGGGAVYDTNNPPNWKTDPELGSAIDIDVPYEVYALVRGKGLRRYLAGDDNTITQDIFLNTSKKDYDSLASATAIDVDGKLLAVADPTNKRVMLFTIQDNDAKNIAFTKSFVYRGTDPAIFKNIKEVVVNEASNNIFVLDGTEIIRLDI